jgi:hypothetical protein
MLIFVAHEAALNAAPDHRTSKILGQAFLAH